MLRQVQNASQQHYGCRNKHPGAQQIANELFEFVIRLRVWLVMRHVTIFH